MKTIVIYKSKTGFTKKYAEWIANELAADIFESSMVKVENLMMYDNVIYGGGLYAGGINGAKLITQNLFKLKDKKIIVFATGASPARAEVIQEVRQKNFTPDQESYISFFYMRGGFSYSKLNCFDKILMTLLKWKLKMSKQLTSDDKGMLASYDMPVDFTRSKNIDQLINFIKL